MPTKKYSNLKEEEIMDLWINYGERDINPLYGITNESIFLSSLNP